MRQKQKPGWGLFLLLLAAYTAGSLGWQWYVHHTMSYADVRDALSANVISAGLTWILAWYRWHKADAG